MRNILNMSRDRISTNLFISRATVTRILRCFQTYEDVWTPAHYRQRVKGPKQTLEVEHLIALAQWIETDPSFSLQEIKERIQALSGHDVSLSLICTTLRHRLGYTRKRLSILAQQADEHRRVNYMLTVRVVVQHNNQLVFIDETSTNEKTSNRIYGYSLKGETARCRQNFLKGTRYTATGVFTIDGFIDFYLKEGSMKMTDFEDFFVTCLLPHLNPYPGPRSIVVLDNARIHKSLFVYQLCEFLGVILMFLPPYSPDLTPIELGFHMVKQFMRSNRDRYDNLVTLIVQAFLSVNSDQTATFRKCGYFY